MLTCDHDDDDDDLPILSSAVISHSWSRRRDISICDVEIPIWMTLQSVSKEHFVLTTRTQASPLTPSLLYLSPSLLLFPPPTPPSPPFTRLPLPLLLLLLPSLLSTVPSVISAHTPPPLTPSLNQHSFSPPFATTILPLIPPPHPLFSQSFPHHCLFLLLMLLSPSSPSHLPPSHHGLLDGLIRREGGREGKEESEEARKRGRG